MDSLSSKLSQIQSHSYTDIKIKELFKIISQTKFKNNELSRQKFQIDNISNIISINAKIIKEFEKIIIVKNIF